MGNQYVYSINNKKIRSGKEKNAKPYLQCSLHFSQDGSIIRIVTCVSAINSMIEMP